MAEDNETVTQSASPSSSASAACATSSLPESNTSSSTTSSAKLPSDSSSIPTTDNEKPSTSSSSTKHPDLSDDDANNEDQRMFECNICLDTAHDAVVSLCGHLFCWPCLHQWLETRPNRQSCPVCKAVVTRDKVIPLYGRGGRQVDPRSKIPPRPTPTRQEASDSHRFSWGNGGPAGSFHMSFGIGAFPFGFFASAFNWGAGQQGGVAGGANNFVNQAAMEEQEFLSKLLLWVALVFMIWLLLA